MKVLLDACLSPQAKIELESEGHDVVWAGKFPEDPGDSVLLDLANKEKRVLITLDKDFGELVVRRGASHSGILRLVNLRAIHQGPVAAQVLGRHQKDLENGALITAEPGRIRIRRQSEHDL